MEFTKGDRVNVRYRDRQVPGIIVIASGNSKSLAVEFEAMLGGYVGMMPVFDAGDGYRDLITHEPVEITKL